MPAHHFAASKRLQPRTLASSIKTRPLLERIGNDEISTLRAKVSPKRAL